jgi:hypothetical protein
MIYLLSNGDMMAGLPGVPRELTSCNVDAKRKARRKEGGESPISNLSHTLDNPKIVVRTYAIYTPFSVAEPVPCSREGELVVGNEAL